MGVIKIGLIIGGSYAIGSRLGAWIAIQTKQSDGVATGIKIGTGVVSYFVLATLLR